MSTAGQARNKAIFSRFHDAVNTGDAKLTANTIDEIVEPRVLFHAPLPTGGTGAEAVKKVMTTLLHVFPDLHLKVEDVIAEADEVVGRTTVTGTHQGEYLGIPPTGKTVTYKEIFIFRVASGGRGRTPCRRGPRRT